MLKPPHLGCQGADIWHHIQLGHWAGGRASPSVPVAEASQRPCVHLLVPGSNFCLTGFRNPLEAALYRDMYQLPNHRMVDLRDDRPARLPSYRLEDQVADIQAARSPDIETETPPEDQDPDWPDLA